MDLHRNVLPRYFPFALSHKRICENLRPTTVAGSRIATRLATYQICRFNWRATRRPAPKFLYSLGLSMLPTEADWSLVGLPALLFFLYYPLRLARLLTKYLKRFRSATALPVS
jgi:hypothetical protein